MRLSWSDESKTKEEWKRWKYWSYIENTKEQFDLEELIGLITKPHMLTVPDEIDMAVDSKGKLWIIYRANDGAIYLARANDTLDDWVYHERLLYVPSGSTYPTIVFDNNDRHVIAVEFLPAGSEQKEIWLYEPPYSGAGIRRIADGQHPIIARSANQDTFLFYQAADKNQVLYRKSSEEYSTDHMLGESEGELLPRGFRVHHENITPYHDRYKHLMFYQAEGETLPRYKMSSPVDVFTVGLEIAIKNEQGALSQVEVYLYGIGKQTSDENGKVLFLGLDYPQKITYKLTHPSYKNFPMGTIEILTGDAGTLVERTITMFRTQDSQLGEGLQTSWEVLGIEWEYLGAIKELVSEPLNTLLAVDGIQWEGLSTIIECIQEDVPTVLQVQGLVWDFIHRDYSSHEEELSMSLTVQSILWVEVTE